MKTLDNFIIVLSLIVLTTSCEKKDSEKKDETSTELAIDCSDLNGVWIETSWQYNDSVFTSYNYGCNNDGYCCGAVEVDVLGSSFNKKDTILVDGVPYRIISISNNDWGCFSNENHMKNFRCGLDLSMINPPANSKYALTIGKRRND